MRKVVAPLLVSTALMVVAAPWASAEGTACPPGWDETPASAFPEYDHNGDGTICTKEVPGNGNTGEGTVAKDNNSDGGDGADKQE